MLNFLLRWSVPNPNLMSCTNEGKRSILKLDEIQKGRFLITLPPIWGMEFHDWLELIRLIMEISLDYNADTLGSALVMLLSHFIAQNQGSLLLEPGVCWYTFSNMDVSCLRFWLDACWKSSYDKLPSISARKVKLLLILWHFRYMAL